MNAKPSPEGEGWVRGNQNKENAYLSPPHPSLLTHGEEANIAKSTALGKKVAYYPFKGICLTDTSSQLYEKDDLVSQILVDNSARRTKQKAKSKKQKALDIRVIIGNSPYPAWQESANDNNANVEYKSLDEKIRSTCAANFTATNKNALYDSYIRAIR